MARVRSVTARIRALCRMSHGSALHRSRSMCGKMSRLTGPPVALPGGVSKQQKSAIVLRMLTVAEPEMDASTHERSPNPDAKYTRGGSHAVVSLQKPIDDGKARA